jgi:hypothetical protein
VVAYYLGMTRTTPTTVKPSPIQSFPPSSQDPQVSISQLIGGNPGLEEMRQVTAGNKTVRTDAFLDCINRYGFSVLHQEALSALSSITEPHRGKVVSVFTGRGYAEAQMVAAGMDVIGFDRKVPERRWLLDTHEGPHGLSWNRLADRALFMSFPEGAKGSKGIPCEIVDSYLAAGGRTVILVAEAHPTQHAIKCDGALIERLKEGECISRIELPKWPVVDAFVGYGHSYHTFEPVLTAYRFTRRS